jgi:glycosyltransferase involved in cell wall biosynthesis
MRIAEVSPLYERVPPRLYGGTERIVSYLTEELVRQGHQVTLFASGDSITTAELAPCCDEALRLNPHCVDPLAHHVLMLEKVFSRVDDFDVIHFHCDYLHFPLSRRFGKPHVTTLHGRLDLPDLPHIYEEFDEMPVVSISDAQRDPLPWLNWQGTVHHGLPPDLYPFCDQPGDYLAFLGRVSPEKGVDRAIEIARRARRPLRIAAKVDRADQKYFEKVIEPLLRQSHVEFLGEIGESEKPAFLGQARALLFPVDWPEPFGLVMIEALACGTPVVAFRRGSVPEVLDNAQTGFICDTIDEAVEAVGQIEQLSRRRCRQTFEERFTAARMASDYLKIFQKQLEAGSHHARGDRGRQAVLHSRNVAAR